MITKYRYWIAFSTAIIIALFYFLTSAPNSNIGIGQEYSGESINLNSKRSHHRSQVSNNDSSHALSYKWPLGETAKYQVFINADVSQGLLGHGKKETNTQSSEYKIHIKVIEKKDDRIITLVKLEDTVVTVNNNHYASTESMLSETPFLVHWTPRGEIIDYEFPKQLHEENMNMIKRCIFATIIMPEDPEIVDSWYVEESAIGVKYTGKYTFADGLINKSKSNLINNQGGELKIGISDFTGVAGEFWIDNFSGKETNEIKLELSDDPQVVAVINTKTKLGIHRLSGTSDALNKMGFPHELHALQDYISNYSLDTRLNTAYLGAAYLDEIKLKAKELKQKTSLHQIIEVLHNTIAKAGSSFSETHEARQLLKDWLSIFPEDASKLDSYLFSKDGNQTLSSFIFEALWDVAPKTEVMQSHLTKLIGDIGNMPLGVQLQLVTGANKKMKLNNQGLKDALWNLAFDQSNLQSSVSNAAKYALATLARENGELMDPIKAKMLEVLSFSTYAPVSQKVAIGVLSNAAIDDSEVTSVVEEIIYGGLFYEVDQNTEGIDASLENRSLGVASLEYLRKMEIWQTQEFLDYAQKPYEQSLRQHALNIVRNSGAVNYDANTARILSNIVANKSDRSDVRLGAAMALSENTQSSFVAEAIDLLIKGSDLELKYKMELSDTNNPTPEMEVVIQEFNQQKEVSDIVIKELTELKSSLTIEQLEERLRLNGQVLE